MKFLAFNGSYKARPCSRPFNGIYYALSFVQLQDGKDSVNSLCMGSTRMQMSR